MQSSQRIAAIDIMRALTVLLMVFVNDLWTLTDIPPWLEHAKADEDSMGLADIVFPAFLFIVGLSIPFAINVRYKRGHDTITTLKHIVFRAFALILMGLFMVNWENITDGYMLINRWWWELLMVIAFGFIWLDYDGFNNVPKSRVYTFILTGFGILFFLGFIYKSGTPESPIGMKTHWWGILGLIGWAYLLNALLFVVYRNRIWAAVIVYLTLLVLNAREFTELWSMPSFTLIVGASNYFCVISGVLASLIFLKMKDNKTLWGFAGVLIALAIANIVFGFATRPIWGISKIMGTPSWTTLCMGICFLCFAGLIIVADVYEFTGWAKIISPAGTSTLTCYMLPFIIYSVLMLVNFSLPSNLTSGTTGIVKSLLFALLVIQLTRLMERLNLRLRI